MQNLQTKYQKEIAPALVKELELKNVMAVPRILKVVVNLGLKEAAHDDGVLTKAQTKLSLICGQKPKLCRAKVSIASFKLSKGDPIGLAVTLRGKRMFDFLEKLFTIVLPRVRDFRGVSPTAFDQRGNYTLGITEQIVFPEVEFDRTEKNKGLGITIVMNSTDSKHNKRLLELLGMPFANAQGKPFEK
ncbi:50S ribosomal protein L5 [Candidatus Shapirobacteria bacterium CG08_land_8_20_14_0_20_39_18]|uniref:Large ribosomal subunit protein uL5 n=1 Tax=Candidatus Shapirobacteria bacterium CG08_land_8_20_14_0_20_39_18 TaxID=1974883 RepID=A0A2M6XEA3_9BACT|nr:MAG: 50S ribosomal protein L5 [Candidatus Shapirobacteria bacterium CG08_land_8_20_14_0_20_39_18]PIY66414.1 MAG: 50S ribosomal protein L5 [Candidatus Shapirobacteria bacterium CG_4_10_14_0_8_um_filter_39_15]